jgi:Ca2+-binding RTX toxin-like protein
MHCLCSFVEYLCSFVEFFLPTPMHPRGMATIPIYGTLGQRHTLYVSRHTGRVPCLTRQGPRSISRSVVAGPWTLLPTTRRRKMRKVVLLIATMALALLMASGVALAATFTCTTNPCNGTSVADVITGTVNAETINGQGGNDTISARDANDILSGGPGNDSMNGELGNDSLNGGTNNDTLNGGSGNDTYKFSNSWGADTIPSDAGGVDTLNFSALTAAFTGGLGMKLDLNTMTAPCSSTSGACVSVGGNFIENMVGTQFNDGLTGNSLANTFTGNAGNDVLLGSEGNDTLKGVTGDDTMAGGTGNDKFNDTGGNDTYYIDPNNGTDTVADGAGIGDWVKGNFDFATMPNLTINLTSGTGHEVSVGTTTNTMNWSNNVIENAQGHVGNDNISQNSSDNILVGAHGADTYKGYKSGFGHDTIADTVPSSPDKLDLSATFNLADADFFFARDETGRASWLVLVFADGSEIDIQDYFDGTSTTPCSEGPGDGHIETISFANDPSVDLAQAKSLVGCGGSATPSASPFRDAQETGTHELASEPQEVSVALP